ncbi:MAG: ABC transporter ATP-binding protein [Oscillospiraceae bacterium]|nr:ABC transporter ATP-binding protein [Oscillospiraceae bacterium]
MGDAMLQLNSIRKRFGDHEVLCGIDLSVERGEFITLLGSSGCGKTSLLRIIAGLEFCDSGEVILEGRNVTNDPPEKRNVNMVFQNYALFPHMNVTENVGYSLRLKHKSRREIEKAVSDALSLVQLPGFETRKPSELSGGQRQRVAIARALVNEPGVLLLDEPLGALDLQLRRQMQIELKRLQKSLGITFIYITHDQEEALNMSDRIAVMKNGIFQQIGTPTEIYDRPKNAYVAHFVGSANILSGTAAVENGSLFLCYGGGRVSLGVQHPATENGAPLTVAVRSESIDLLPPEAAGVPAVVKEKSFSAGMLRIALQVEDGAEIVASRHGIDYSVSPGDSLSISFSPEHAVIVEAEDEKP